MDSQILRIPNKYGELITSISDEEAGKLMKSIFLRDSSELNGILKTYYNIIIVDIDNIENQVNKGKEGGKKGGRPPNRKPSGLENKKPPLFENENPSKDKISKDKIKEDKVNKVININSNELIEQSSTELVEFGKSEINEMQELIKQTVKSLDLAYKPGSNERKRIQNILTGKDFGENCEKANMSRSDFVRNIIFISTKLDFWCGKIYNAETLYKHYVQIYNEALKLKQTKQKEMEKKNDCPFPIND